MAGLILTMTSANLARAQCALTAPSEDALHPIQAALAAMKKPECDTAQITQQFNADYKKKIEPIFQNKCTACHDSKAPTPWYGGGSHAPLLITESEIIPGAGILGIPLKVVALDMEKGVAKLNVTHGFPFSSKFTSSQSALLQEIRDQITKGKMPPPQYVHGHRIATGHWKTPAYLLDSEKKEIMDFADRWKSQISCYDRTLAQCSVPSAQKVQPANAPMGTAVSVRSALGKCLECHMPGGNEPNLMGADGKSPNLELLKSKPSLLQTMITHMQSTGDDHMPPGDLDSNKTAHDVLTLQAWLKNGSPVK